MTGRRAYKGKHRLRRKSLAEIDDDIMWEQYEAAKAADQATLKLYTQVYKAREK